MNALKLIKQELLLRMGREWVQQLLVHKNINVAQVPEHKPPHCNQFRYSYFTFSVLNSQAIKTSVSFTEIFSKEDSERK